MVLRFGKKSKILVVVLVLLIGLASFISWASEKTTGTIQVSAPRTTQQAAAFKIYDGKYITFRYLGTYDAKQLKAENGDLELATLDAKTNYEKRLVVSVSALSSGSLTGDSNYGLRKSQPNNYRELAVTVDGAPATLFIKSDGLEQTVFIPKDGRVASLSFVTVGTVGDLTAEVSALLATFSWKP